MSNTPVATNGLTFDDEFNTFTASGDGWSGTWMTHFPFGGESAFTLPTSKEAQYYSSDMSGSNSPFSLSNGVLDITATKAAAGSNPYGLPYTSGLITTDKSFAQTYGYFEIRAELPAGQGLWPTFWLLPVNSVDPTELDVFEVLGNDPKTLHATTHGSSGQSQPFTIPDVSTGFHTYGVDWEPTTVTFYMDGVKLGSTATPASMDIPMYMLLNVAVGGAGSWPGAPDATTPFPATMQIDYVHAYATAATTYIGGKASYPAPLVSVLGTGPDTLSLVMSEDAYQGDAQFTISVDGQQVGGVQTVTASRTASGGQTFQVNGTFSTGSHAVSVNFLNDAWGGTSAADRNLYINNVAVDGSAVANSAVSLFSNGAQSVQFFGTSPSYQPTVVIGSGKSTLALQIAEDAYLGDAQFTVSVDGSQVGGIQTATAPHGSGSTQALDVMGNFGAGTHTVSVKFLNDAYGGSASTDRNLYVQSATIDNAAVANSQLTLLGNGAQSISFQGSTQPDTLTVGVSEDAYKGDAQYYIVVDGYIAGWGANTATASHAAGQVNLQTINNTWGTPTFWGNGPHTIGVQFLNGLSDAGGTRDLYINSVNYNGTSVAMSPIEQSSNGTAYVKVPGTPGINSLTLHMAEDAYLGDAQFTVAIDGKQVGSTGTVSASNSVGATQAFNFSAVLAAGTHDVALSFINDAYGGSSATDRNLYVHGADLNGTALSTPSWSGAMMSNGTGHFTLTVPSS